MSKRAIILVDNGVQDQEFWYPYYRLQEAGYQVSVAGPAQALPFTPHSVIGPGGAHRALAPVKGKYGIPITTNLYLDDLGDIMSLGMPGTRVVVIPGGWECPEKLRMNRNVLAYVKACFDDHGTSMWKPPVVAAICHGPWVLASAGVLKGYKATCYAGMRDDIVNAGAEYVDAPVVTDRRLVTSPHYRDCPAFMKEVLRLAEAG